MRFNLKFYNRLMTALSCMALLSLPVLSLAKAPQIEYPWEKETFTSSGTSLLAELNRNDAQNKLQLKAFARESCYQEMMTQILALPVDSTLQISSLVQLRPDMENTLQAVVRGYGHFEPITYQTLTTASTQIYLQGDILAKYVKGFHLSILKKQEQEKLKAAEKKIKTSKTKTQPTKLEPTLIKETRVQELSKDTSFSLPYRVAQAKGLLKEKTAVDYRKKLDTLSFDEKITFGKWMSDRTYMQDYPLQESIQFSKPRLNKEKNSIQIDAKLDLNKLRNTFNKIEKTNTKNQ